MYDRMRHIIGILIGLLLLLPGISSAVSNRIAILPIEDLTEGPNGLNYEITDQIISHLHQRDMAVIPENSVISFLARNRIRWLGFLTTDQILQAKKELDADLILFGTSYKRYAAKTPPAYGITLTLVRTEDARTIWSASRALSREDDQKFLGIDEPQTVADLLPIVVGDILSDFPISLESAEDHLARISIKSAILSPQYVRPNENVQCKIVLSDFPAGEGKPKVYVKEGNRIHVAQEAPDNPYYQVTWTRGPLEKGIAGGMSNKNVRLAMAPSTSMYETILTSPSDGWYPVTLIVDWPSGKKIVAFIGKYYVDSKAPEVQLNAKGIQIEDIVSFNDKVTVIPKMVVREPIVSWEVTIRNDQGEDLLREKGNGSLPPRFVWNGRDNAGFVASNELYTFTLRTWDRALNEGISSEKVFFSRVPPGIQVKAYEKGEDIIIDVDRDNDRIPLKFWHMEVRFDSGKLYRSEGGQQLPKMMAIPSVDISESTNLDCKVVMRDILGNESKKVIKNINLLARQFETTDILPDSGAKEKEDVWSEDF